MLRRTIDFISAGLLTIILSPIFIFTAIAIKLDSDGGIFFFQERVGLNGKVFKLIKFRSMRAKLMTDIDLTQGDSDSRITKVGKFIRKLHLDEAIQLVNVILGDMSLIGPRPEVAKFTKYYPEKWAKVLSVRPGITGLAAINLADYEYEALKNAKDVVQTYVDEILPQKLDMEINYITSRTLKIDALILLATVLRVMGIKLGINFSK